MNQVPAGTRPPAPARSCLEAARRSILLAIVMVAAGPAYAHHSFAVEFDATRFGRFDGIVKEIWFRAPHVRYYITVLRNGNEETWDVHALSPTSLRRVGITTETLRVGDHVKVEGYLGRNDTKKLYLLRLTGADGKSYQLSPDAPAQPGAAAERS